MAGGNAKKNKIGGAPKQKGRLVAALLQSQASAALRLKLSNAAKDKEERSKSSKAGVTQGQMKKKRQAERAEEREKERRDTIERDRDGMAVDGEVVALEPGMGMGKRAREERERRKGTVPYKLGEKVLLVGEGNFSFAHSLLLLSPPCITPHLLLATSYDSLEVAHSKYPDLEIHVDAIKAKGARVIFGVDATNLKKCREVREGTGEWDRVAFMFPHVGAGITDQNRNIRANQTLILNFFRSVAPFLRKGTSASTTASHNVKKKADHGSVWSSKKGAKNANKRRQTDDDEDEDEMLPSEDEEEDLDEDPESADLTTAKNSDLTLALAPPPPTTSGTVLITLRTTSPYSLWSLPHLGTRGSLLAPSLLPRPLPPTPQPNYKILRSFEFSLADYEGYEHRRTVGFKEGVSSGKNEDLMLTAKERGEKRREEKEAREREEKEVREEEGGLIGKDGKRGKVERRGAMRTWEFERVEERDVDMDYDDAA